MPETRSTASADRVRPQFRDLVDVHRGKLLVGLGLVAVLLGGTWFYNRSVVLKRQRAETQYFRARQLAESDSTRGLAELRAVVSRYKGTPAGTQAALTLAQSLYDQGKPREGLEVLGGVEESAGKNFAAAVHALAAVGHENLNHFVEAARSYRRAAEASRFKNDRLDYLASAARAFMAAGRNNEALEIWRELADDPSQVLAAEARVRIGELTASPAGS